MSGLWIGFMIFPTGRKVQHDRGDEWRRHTKRRHSAAKELAAREAAATMHLNETLGAGHGDEQQRIPWSEWISIPHHENLVEQAQRQADARERELHTWSQITLMEAHDPELISALRNALGERRELTDSQRRVQRLRANGATQQEAAHYLEMTQQAIADHESRIEAKTTRPAPPLKLVAERLGISESAVSHRVRRLSEIARKHSTNHL